MGDEFRMFILAIEESCQEECDEDPTTRDCPHGDQSRALDIFPKGRPGVKLGASEKGAGLGLAGESEPTYVLLKAEGTNSSVKLTNKDGREQTTQAVASGFAMSNDVVTLIFGLS